MQSLGKITGVCLFGAALTVAVSLLFAGCSKDSPSWWSPAPREVEATLPALAVAEAVLVEPMGSRALTADAAANVAGTAAASADVIAYGSPDGMASENLFTVDLGPDEGMKASAPQLPPPTRADVSLQNVWVLQFDSSGATKACAYAGTVAAGAKVKAALQSGEGYTVWIVANGPASGGLTTTNPATLSDFESKLLYTATPASDELIPLSGKLTNVKVLDNGQVLVGSDNTVVPEVTLRRVLARVDVLLEYSVDGAELDGVWLYQVPAGACYGVNSEATDFPASGDASNFGYRDGYTEGLAPKSSGSGTVTHTWYIGDNRRGQVPTIQWEKNKGSKNAPKMATYARIKSHESGDVTKGLFHDVYLGENVTTDFDVLRNHHYIYRVRIGGTLVQQKVLAQHDERVTLGDFYPYVVDGNTIVVKDAFGQADPALYPIHEPWMTTPAHSEADANANVSGYNTVSERFELAERNAAGPSRWSSGFCNNYSQASDQSDKGLWRMPTIRELLLINKLRDRLTVSLPGGGTWSTTEYSADNNQAWDFVFPQQTLRHAAKSGVSYGYCVKDLGEYSATITGASVAPSGDIPGQGATYSVTLEGILPPSGVEVRVRSDGQTLVNGVATASGTAVQLAVPANESWNARTVSFEYLWKGTWTPFGDERSQTGYSVTATHDAPASIPGQGGNYAVTLTGHFPADGVSVRANIAGADPVTGLVMKAGTAVQLAVPGNESWDARTVSFEYLWKGTWIRIGDQRSQGAGWTITKAETNAPATIPGQGGTYSVTLTGTLPSGGVEVRANISGATPVTGKATNSGTAVRLTVPANTTGKTRTVAFEWKGATGWNKIGANGTQEVVVPEYSKRAAMTLKQCENFCVDKGGVPTQALNYNKTWYIPPGTSAVYYWTCSLADDTREVLYTKHPTNGVYETIRATGEEYVGCRCVNE